METIVKDVMQFVNLINDNVELKLKKGNYNISDLVLDLDKNIYFEKVYDGKELIFDNLSNLSIYGEEVSTQILASPRYANVITFKNCEDIKIGNLTFGHTESLGECSGGVLKFENCNNVDLNNLILFGCGTYGLILKDVKNLKVNNSIIKECTNGILSITDSEEISFNNCNFYENEKYDLINIAYTKSVKFYECNLNNNYCGIDNFMFSITKSKDILLENCRFNNNNVIYFIKDYNDVTILNKKFDGNLFDFTEYDKTENQYNNNAMQIDLTNNKKLIYNEDFIKIIENEVILSSGFNSKPILSPNKSKILFLSPFGWESRSDLYLYDLSNNEHKIIITYDRVMNEISQQATIKLLKWLDENNIMCIIGQSQGTVSKGGDVYRYNLMEDRIESVYINENNEEVVNFGVVDGKIQLTIIHFNKDFTDYDIKSKIL